MAYVYGIGEERLRTGQPLAATLDIDGKSTALTLEPYDDVALAPVTSDLVRSLLRARAASVLIKDYRSPDADRLKLDGAGPKIQSALKSCFKS